MIIKINHSLSGVDSKGNNFQFGSGATIDTAEHKDIDFSTWVSSGLAEVIDEDKPKKVKKKSESK